MNDDVAEHVKNNRLVLNSIFKSVKFCDLKGLALPVQRNDHNIINIKENLIVAGNKRTLLKFTLYGGVNILNNHLETSSKTAS